MNYNFKKKKSKFVLIFIICIIIILFINGCKKDSEITKSSNISTNSTESMNPKFKELKKLKPTNKWRNYPNAYSKKCISETDKILDEFIYSLSLIGENPQKKEVMKCVESVVKKLNELDIKYEHFIESIERDELYDYIVKCVEVTGFKPEGDITEEWREW